MESVMVLEYQSQFGSIYSCMKDFPISIERINRFFDNHTFVVYLQPTHSEDFTVPTNVKVELTGVKDYISMGNNGSHVQYTIYILPTNESSDAINKMWGNLYGKEKDISTSSREYNTLRWVMTEKLENFLKYFGIDKRVICTKVVNKLADK